MPFSLPEGYFEQFPAQMLQLVQDEPILNLPKAMPFSIREGYFEQFPSGMMEHIRDEATVSPFAELTKTVPFSMPAGYFEQLPAQVMDNIRKDEVREELAAISPLLASVPKSVPFSVPAGYFEQLDASVAAIASKPATVINLRPRRMMIYKWVAAACLIALASTSTLYFMRNNNYRETSTTPAVNLAEVNLSEVSDQEIIDYLQTHMDAFDKENLMGYSTEAESTPLPASTDLSTEAIEHYLENTSLLKEQSPTRN